ncbi:MAG TPA: hypothetical protein DDZ88_05535 [Verrucomicrobiales bacterium]|nr:hypothetical protein [Verrucomicrobiales bacterium]
MGVIMKRFHSARGSLSIVVLAMGVGMAVAAETLENPALRWAAEGPGGVPSFTKHVVPMFLKAGCSTRDCHGAFQGRNGFRLSLFGYDRVLDHKELTADTEKDEPKGKPRSRIDRANPDASLALRKPLEDGLEHEGGTRLKRGSWQYRMLRDWIAAGAPFDKATEPYLEKLELLPEEIRLTPSAKSNPVDLRVLAQFSDGSRLDVTALATFSSNDEGIVKVSKNGEVSAIGATGDTHLVASYGAEVATAQVMAADARGLANFPDFPPNNPVDGFVAAKLRKLGIQPSDRCDDEAFLRRAFIDTIGTLPTPAEAREFLADSHPDKRARLIDRLLDRPEYALYWASIWSDWTGNADGNLNPNIKVTWLWHDWFVDKFQRNVPFDQLARGIIVASSLEGRSLEAYQAENKAVSSRINITGGAPKSSFDDGTYGRRQTLDLYWLKRDGDPEEMAIRSASTFLGIQINCAQCHKHPFDRWTQDDFESFTSFFRVMDMRSIDGGDRPNRRDYHLVALYPGYRRGKEGVVKKHPPKILGGETVGYDPKAGADPRERLWQWMVDPQNPYFARSIVNRLWGHYFGTGIVHPIDDFNAANPPSNPELLDWLARDFIEHQFDLKHLHRRILNSRTWQLSHVPNDTNRHDRRNFSHAQLKRMPAEVFYDALLAVTGTDQRVSATYAPPGSRTIGLAATRLGSDGPEYALRIFGRPKREQTCACERSSETGLSQALFLLNDVDVIERVADPKGSAAHLARRFPSAADDAPLAEEAYLLALGRRPDAAELKRVTDFLQSSHTNMPREEAVRDLLWSLLNVREFLFVR